MEDKLAVFAAPILQLDNNVLLLLGITYSINGLYARRSRRTIIDKVNSPQLMLAATPRNKWRERNPKTGRKISSIWRQAVFARFPNAVRN